MQFNISGRIKAQNSIRVYLSGLYAVNGFKQQSFHGLLLRPLVLFDIVFPYARFIKAETFFL